jgi:hypothetical protein
MHFFMFLLFFCLIQNSLRTILRGRGLLDSRLSPRVFGRYALTAASLWGIGIGVILNNVYFIPIVT